MNTLIDKAIDGLFIFIGVFFAFHFDQYQQDLTSKRELDFNLTQIMRDLPEKEPPSKVARFQIEQTKHENGTCSLPINMNFESTGLGEEYLSLIKKRGLVRFVDDKRLIRKLTYYYDELVPKYKKVKDRYYSVWQELVIKEKSNRMHHCLNENELETLKNQIKPYHMRAQVAFGFAQTIGYDIYKALQKLGYKPPPKRTQRFEYTFEEVDPEEIEKEEGEDHPHNKEKALLEHLKKKSQEDDSPVIK